ncbi:MAG: thiamine pyrophosphate-dependent dehydrogenase E1 component subunit alpha [Pirellulaceae bacterium]
MTQLTHAAIRAAGRYTGLSLRGADPDLVKRLHRFMLRLRICEQALMDEYHPADEMRCPIHFCIGQEAAPAALHEELEAEDYLFSHHRSHGYYLAKRAPLGALVAELYGKETGANGGRAGSQDLSSPVCRMYGGAILTGAVAISVGAALGEQLRGGRQVSVTGFGEAATEEGIFWEAVNFAALRKLPLVFVCENNLYSMYSPQLKRQPDDGISRRVAAFGVPTETIFGNDVVAVHQSVAGAVARARQGEGPTFIETYTYRWNGHVGPESDDWLEYRSEDELGFWKDNCPLALLEERMLESGWLTAQSKEQIVRESSEEIAAAIQFAKDSPFPTSPDWQGMNYAAETPAADALLQASSSSQFDQNQTFSMPGPY